MRLLARGSALSIPLRDSSVHCCVTSPPYWGLRDYGIAGQLGLERTPEEYVGNMVRVFREVRRCLRDDGTLWLNLGDSYAGSWGAQSRGNDAGEASSRLEGSSMLSARQIVSHPLGQNGTGSLKNTPGLKAKDLVGIPWRVAFALQADGWYLRSDIIWAKPNPMPESVRDRPTKAHEYLFLLAKSERYYYDGDAVREPGCRYAWNTQKFKGGDITRHHGSTVGTEEADPTAGRNRRSVWTVATQPYSGAHFATFPEKLVEPCILAGTSAKGCCPECGAHWERIVEREPTETRENVRQRNAGGRTDGYTRITAGGGIKPDAVTTTGWRPTCDHGRDPVPCRVLDPFAGTATAVRVANRLGRKGIGLDINPKYLDLAGDRTANVQMEFA